MFVNISEMFYHQSAENASEPTEIIHYKEL